MNERDFDEREPFLEPLKADPSSSKLHVSSAKSRHNSCLSSKFFAVVLLLCSAGAAFYYSTQSNGVDLNYQILNIYDTLIGGYGSDRAVFSCSGHGVKVLDGKCLCDVGYAGSDCLTRLSSDTLKSKPETICLVIESFGSLGSTSNIQGQGQANAELALSLAKSGYTVTVLYTGIDNPQFTSVASMFSRKGIAVTRLTATGLDFGENSLESKSYAVYQHILQLPSQFSHVYFEASSGTGYYTLLAQSQGLFCTDTVFINGIDALTVDAAGRIDSGDDTFIVTDKESLKRDFLMRKSVELGDLNIFSSDVVFDAVLSANWTLNKEASQVLSKPIPKSAETATHVSEVITEIVFVGPMTHGGGLKVFCDAIDSLISDIHATKTRVTFLNPSGPSPTFMNDLKSNEYVELRSLNWDAFDISWSIHTAADLDEIVSYMTKMGRLAIVPALNDPVASIAKALIQAKVPMVLSELSGATDVLSESDKASLVVPANSETIAAKVKNILALSESIPVAQTLPIVSISSWIKALESASPRTCNKAFEEMTEKPFVSVVLVHHNRHQLLKQAIASLDAQTYKNFEVILVDDGSTDPASLAYVRELSWTWWETKGWKVLFESNRYLGAARNTGAKAASGKYVLFLDDDDYSKPHHIETLVKVAVNTKSDIVTGGHDTFNGRARPTSAHSNSRFVPLGAAPLVGMLQNVYGDSAILVRRDYFIDVAGFTEDFGVGFEDYEFLARAALKGHKMQAVPEALHWYRQQGATMSTATNLKTNQLRMLRPYIESNPTASEQQKAVFLNVQTVFFEKYGTAFNENPFALRRDNSTGQPGENPIPEVPIPPVNPYITPCKAIFDSTGASAIKISQQIAWSHKTRSACWNMGANTLPTPGDDNAIFLNVAVQPVYPSGSPAGSPILKIAPCEDQYSDVWNLLRVVVDKNTPKDFYKTFDSLDVTGAHSYGYFNRPMIPPGSKFDGSVIGNVVPTLQQAWYKGKPVFYADFGAVPGSTKWMKTVSAGKMVNVLGAGPVASDASPSSTGFYSVYAVDPAGVERYQPNDFRSFQEFSFPYVPAYAASTDGTLHKEVLNCPFITMDKAPKPATSHQTFLYGLEPEIAPKTADVTVVLWGSLFKASSVVYVNGVAFSGTKKVISSEYLTITLDLSKFAGDSGSVTIYVDDSIPYSIRYYSIPATVSAVTSATLYTKTPSQVIQITGSNLPVLAGAFCVYNFTANGVAMPLTVTSPTTASCKLPVTAMSGAYTVKIAMAASKYDVPQLKYVQGNFYQFPLLPVSGGKTLTVQVIAHGPVAISAQFGDSGASIYVDLDTPASIINYDKFKNDQKVSFVDTSYSLPCSAVFETSYAAGDAALPIRGKLSSGGQGDCFVQQLTGTRLKILLQSSFAAYDAQAIVPLNGLTILQGSLWAADQLLCEPYMSKVVVAAPAVIPTPEISIVAPVFVPRCDGLVVPLDMTSTSGSAGRNYSASSLTVEANSVGPKGAKEALNAYLADFLQHFDTKAICNIPIELFWTGSGGAYDSFTFTLSVQNYLGGSDVQSVTVNIGQDATVPYVTVAGVPQTNAKVAQFQILDAQVSQVCGVAKEVAIEWVTDPATCPGLAATVQTGSSQLVIPPHALAASTVCSVNLKVKYTDQENWCESKTSFKTAPEIFQVLAGSSRSIGASDKLVVGANFYSDSHISNTPDEEFMCAWNCIKGDSGFLCPDSVFAMMSGCTGNDLTAKLGSGSYNFDVVVTEKATGKITSSPNPVSIKLVSGRVPAVQISLPFAVISPYSDKFALTADVDASTVSSMQSLKYSWSGCDDPSYSTLDFKDASNFLTDVSSAQVLKFAPGVLHADTQYCVSLTVQDGSAVGTASTVFSTFEVPFGGICQLEKASVAEINQPLQYSCPYWAVDPSAQPLSFKFFVRGQGQTAWTQVSPTSRSAQIQSVFTSGSYDIRVTVLDKYGSTITGVASSFAASADPSLKANAGSLQCSSTVCTLLKTAITTFKQTKNSGEAAKAIGAAALQVDVESPDFGTILDLLTSFASSVYIDTAATGPFLASILQTIAGQGYKMPDSAVDDFLVLAGAIVSRISDSGKLETPQNCVGVLSAESLFLALDQVMGTFSGLKVANEKRTQSIATFNSALESLEVCFARNKAPLEVPYQFKAGYMSRSVASAFAGVDSNFCGFAVSGNGVQTSDSIISYSCGTKSSASYPGTGSGKNTIVGVDDTIQDLTIRNSQGVDIGSKQTNFSIPISSSFDKTFAVTNSDGMFQAVCAWYKPSGQWSQEGCTTLSVAQGVVSCSCNHLTDFVVGAVQIGDGGAPAGGLSAGLIVACVVGALALVVATAGTVMHLKKQAANKVPADGSLLPTSAPPPVPIEAANVAVVPDATPIVPPPSVKPPIKPILDGVAVAAAAVAASAVVAAAVAGAPGSRPLPSYSRPPSYEYHMSKMGR
ncbi:hypothetical protein HDU80_010452 [Chytriomyces hyalinus]|nr:hypothetical protein HDU80_010452 [Chytriomyces hyalinus]